jgi:hypothetical protein
MWKEAVVAYFKALAQNLLGGTGGTEKVSVTITNFGVGT